MKRSAGLLAVLLAAGPAHSQEQPKRPPITGIARVRLYSADLHKSRQFYRHGLGLANSTAGCTGKATPCFAVNDHQQVELVQIAAGAPDNLLAEIAFATPDVAQMHSYLAAHDIRTSAIVKDRDGVQHFELLDPEKNHIAFVQLPSQHFFTAAPEQTSQHLIHAGFIVRDMAKQNHFYVDLLGFRLYWYGGFKDLAYTGEGSEKNIDWYELQVPDGDNWIEYMLNIPANAKAPERGIQNHFSFGVRKIDLATKQLRNHNVAKLDGPEIGRDGKQGLDVYDPDGTRVEFMEFTPSKEPCCHPYAAAHPQP